jgi:hypothetical protein
MPHLAWISRLNFMASAIFMLAAISVRSNPEVTATTGPIEATPDYGMTIVATGLAVIIAVAIVGAVLLMAIRKKQ